MSTIILDFGSGNTCKNSKEYIRYMYDRLIEIDHEKHEIIVKWQLFERAGVNMPLSKSAFNYAYEYGTEKGYKVTASVFDVNSLEFLLLKNIPFIKIANNRMLDYLIDKIPEDIKIYMSTSVPILFIEKHKNIEQMWCVSKYPANEDDYLNMNLKPGCCISDHTTNFNIYRKLTPMVIEWHYKLKNSTGLDAGEFARTPEQLSEIL